MSLAFRLRDVGAHKGILVTTQGFQAGATVVAKASGIALLIAANGRLGKTWSGFTAQLYEVGIDRLGLDIDVAESMIRVCGHRRIVCNEEWQLERLAEDHHVTDEIFFITSESEKRLTSDVSTVEALSTHASVEWLV